jgi:hypothetical protein
MDNSANWSEILTRLIIMYHYVRECVKEAYALHYLFVVQLKFIIKNPLKLKTVEPR